MGIVSNQIISSCSYVAIHKFVIIRINIYQAPAKIDAGKVYVGKLIERYQKITCNSVGIF